MIALANPAPAPTQKRYRVRRQRPADDESPTSRPTGAIKAGELYASQTFAARLGLARWGLRNLLAAGLPARMIGGRKFILADEALAWFATQPVAPPPKRLKRAGAGT